MLPRASIKWLPVWTVVQQMISDFLLGAEMPLRTFTQDNPAVFTEAQTSMFNHPSPLCCLSHRDTQHLVVYTSKSESQAMFCSIKLNIWLMSFLCICTMHIQLKTSNLLALSVNLTTSRQSGKEMSTEHNKCHPLVDMMECLNLHCITSYKCYNPASTGPLWVIKPLLSFCFFSFFTNTVCKIFWLCLESVNWWQESPSSSLVIKPYITTSFKMTDSP